jgi:transposase
MLRWAQSVGSRDQIVMFAPTLDDSVALDHPVRLFDEVLREMDWREWEGHYCLLEGQPPIHPRVMAGVILYGLSLGIRSSRRLEDATGNRIDFIWLSEGRVIDHSTLAGFRVKFQQPLKDLFKQIGKVAIGLGMANLNTLALDGTVKRSNNSRYATARRSSLEQKLAALDEQIEQWMSQLDQTDKQEQELFGESSPLKLPAELKDLSKRQEKLKAALRKLRELESRRQGRKDVSAKGPSVPMTDPDSSVLKNKAGGFAPNYTVVLATEGQNGLIVDAQVLSDNDEAGSVMPAIHGVRKNFAEPAQEPVKEVLADSNFNSGANLQELKDAQVQAWMPARQEVSSQDNPALRPDPTIPVAAENHPKLPVNPQLKVLDKSAFMYDGPADCYHCPMGRRLEFAGTKGYARDGVKGSYRVYESKDCSACALSGRCLQGKSQVRRLVRDEYEPLREEMAARMGSAQGKARYKRRSFLCETPFAVMNTTMNVRQMLLRGMEKVTMEVQWICCAYNLRKLAGLLSARRAAASPAG